MRLPALWSSVHSATISVTTRIKVQTSKDGLIHSFDLGSLQIYSGFTGEKKQTPIITSSSTAALAKEWRRRLRSRTKGKGHWGLWELTPVDSAICRFALYTLRDIAAGSFPRWSSQATTHLALREKSVQQAVGVKHGVPFKSSGSCCKDVFVCSPRQR